MINTNIIKSISDGNLEELKRIPKIKITEDFSKNPSSLHCLSLMEGSCCAQVKS
jgi:hypothetical protein